MTRQSSSGRTADTGPPLPALDAVLGRRRFRALDDGFVRVVDYMGHDGSGRAGGARLVRRRHEARSTRIAASSGICCATQHTTPFEMCEITLHVRVPMDYVATVDPPSHGQRQRVFHALFGRHRRSAARQARMSGAGNPPDNRQGSAGFLDAAKQGKAALGGRNASCRSSRGRRMQTRLARAGRRARAGAEGSAAVDLYRGLLEE